MKNKHILSVLVLMITFLFSLTLNAQINTPSGAVVPFGANPSYQYGIMPTNLPTGGAYGKSQDAADAYNEWKANYVVSCGSNLRVKFDEPNRTVSEGIAYGMLLSAYAADKATFDGLWAYYKANSNGNGFMHWRIDGCSGISGNNGATDAELDATFALLIAENQWPSLNSPYDYSAEATTMMNQIKNKEIHPSSFQTINGDGWGFADNCRNPSYQAPPYYKEFATKNAGNASVWNSAVSAGYSLINANAHATTGLVSDWSNNNGVRNTCNGSPLGVPTDGYGYDACRNPWRMAQDVLWNNDAQAKTICTKIATYVSGQSAAGVKGPLYQDGSLYSGNQHNATFVSTFAMPIMGTTSANQTLMNQMYSETVKIKDKIQNVTLSGYFGNTLRCLSLFMMTGNFWKLGTTSTAEIDITEGAINILNNSTYDFQNQQTSPPASTGKLKTFTIKNLGFQTLNLTGTPKIVLGGTNASQFILTQTSVPATLAGNTSTTFTVEFKPTTTGTKTATLTIASNDPDEGTFVINLTGVGTTNATSPKVTVLNNTTVIANGGNLSLGTSSATSNNNFRLKIKNTGDAPLNINNVTFTGTAFSLVSAITYPLVIPINDSAYVWIKATAATATNATGTITFASNDAASPSYVVNLTATIAACGTAITTNEVYQDFDGNYANTTLGYTNAAWTELFINPTIDAKNPSYSVAKFVRPATGTYNGVRYVLCGTTNNVNITASKYIMSMLVYSPVAGTPVQMNLKTDADVANTTTYPSRSSVTVTTTKANQWERIYFDHSSAIGATGIRHIEIFVDPLAAKGAQTCYLDDIRLDVAPCLTDLPASKILNDYEDHRNISLPWAPPGTFNEVATNPSATGINTSAIVANYVRPNTGTPDATYQIIRYKICGNNLDLSAGKTIISMDVYSSKAGIPVLMSLKDGGTPNPTELFAASAKTTKVNAWETLYFDFSAALGNTSVKAIDLFIDPQATAIATVAERTYYIDNIKYADELPCTSQIPATSIFNDFNANRYIDLAFNPTGPINENAANPSATGINTSTTVANFVRAGTVAPDVVRYKACGPNFTFTGGKSVVSIQIYSPNVGTEVIMSLKAANGTTEVAQGFAKTTTANSWQELSFDFTDMIGKTTAAFMDIIIDPNAKNIATAAQRTYNFDNIRYSNKPEIAVKNGATSILNGDTLNVGTVALGDSIVIPLQLINNGGGDLILSGTPKFKLLGADAVHYYVTTSPSFNSTISGGSSTGFSVVFKPTSNGTKISAIEIANNDSDENPFYINLKGSVLAPEMNVKQATTSIASGTGSYTFATSQLVGTSSTAVTFTIENLGSSVLNLTGTPKIAISGLNATEFTVVQTTTTATVAAAATTTFTVAFSPTSVGAKTATISIANNDSDENPYTFTLNATAVEPEINVKQGATSILNAGTYSFGSQSVGVASTAVTFTIENLGGGILNLTGTPKIAISGANAADFTINQTATTATVAATTGTTTFTVVFTPSAAGLRNAVLSIANSDSDENPYVINISGTGAALPEINVKQATTSIPSAGSYTFTPSVAVGSSSTAVTFTIENLGNAVLNITGTPKVAVSGTNAAEFTVNETTTTATVAAAGTTTFTVTFTPTTVGSKAAVLTIANNDADESAYVINLVATATAAPTPEINVKQAATSIPSAGSYSITPSVAVGSSSTAVTFTVENTGNAVLNLTGTPKVAISGANASEFTVNETTTTATVAAASSTTFTVTFTPTTVGSKAAVLTIANNDSDEGSYVINLVATATAAPAPEINIKQGATDYLTASTYTFSSLTVGSTSTAITFTIQNTGNAVLNLTGTPKVAISGTNASEFVVNQTTTTATVAAAGTTTFTVTFSPTTVGAKSAVLTIASNDADEAAYVINLAGSATALPEPEINVKQATTTILNTTGTYSFGNINLGSSSIATSFTIENLGGAVLNLTGTPKVAISGADAADFSINQTATGSSVVAAGNTNFTVTFTPTTPGVKSATISIANNDTDENPYTFTLTGTGVATPEINVTQGGTTYLNGSSYTMTSVVSGMTGTAVTFTVENLGLGTLNVGTITKTGTNASEFVLTQVVTPTVAGSSSTTFTVTFAPTSVGSKTATISIANDDSNENPYVLTLTGTSTATPTPEVNVVQGATNIANNGGYSFGNQVQSTASAPVTFTIENTGNADLTIGAITVTGAGAADFAVTQPSTTTITSGTSTTFTVTFTPSVIGTRSATISFTNNDSNESPYNIVISGKGIAPSNGSEINVKVGGADIASNGTYDFKNQKPGTSSAPVTFTIENLGTNTLTVSSVLLSGGNYSEFSATSSTSNSIAAGATATFQVYFAPISYGAKSTTLYINNGDNDENPYVINLVGTGSDVTGTQGLINESVEVFPNPTISDVNVTFDKTLSNVEVTVFNSVGIKVMNKSIGSTSFATTETIEMSNLPAGVYIVEINSAEGKAIKRIVKN